MPLVVNRHHFVYVEGIGPPPKKKPRRGKNFLPQPWIYVGRGTPLGNPFRPGNEMSHADALASYRRWLWDRIRRNDWKVMLAMRSIDHDSAIVCSCAPKACHADIVLRAWHWMVEQKLVEIRTVGAL